MTRLIPKLLIKYHKAINKKEVFSTMLVIPATNFTATFSKIGYLRIKKNSGQGKGKLITRLRCTIILPEVETGIVKDKEYIGIISSVYSFNMYPYTKLATIRKAVRFFFQEKLPQQPNYYQPLTGAHPFQDELNLDFI